MIFSKPAHKSRQPLVRTPAACCRRTRPATVADASTSMPSTPSRPGEDLTPFNFQFPTDSDSAPSLMDRVAQNQSLLQDTAQRKQRFVQDSLLSNQPLQQQRLALARMAGEQNVTAARTSADVAVTDSTYQAAQDDAAWREACAADLVSARADLPSILDAINTETDPFRLRDAAITFHGRYSHLAQDPVLGEQYQALDRRVAARLQARDDEFRARISTAAAALRPYIDSAAPDQLTAIRQSPLYRFARIDPAFAREIDAATQQAAVARAIPAIGSAQADRPLAHGGDFAVSFASLKPSTSAQASPASPGSNTGGGFTITVPGLKPPTPPQPSVAPPNPSTNARGASSVTVPGVDPSTPTQASSSKVSLPMETLRSNITDVLKGVDTLTGTTHLFSNEAVELLLGTAAHESGGLKFRDQRNGGPGKGVFQMEEKTYNDLWNNYLSKKPALADAIKETFTPAGGALSFGMIKDNDAYAAVMARVRYAAGNDTALPPVGDTAAQAEYWRKYYNRGGAQDTAGYKRNFDLYVKAILGSKNDGGDGGGK